MSRVGFGCWVAALLLGCASAQPVVVHGVGSVAVGRLRLVPVVDVDPRADGYGDRRLADVTFVDYSRPGFAVIYAEGRAPAKSVTLEIRDGLVRSTMYPPFAAQGAGGVVRIENRSASDHTISCPRSGRVERIAAGAHALLEVAESGEYEFHVLDVPGATTRVFAAPGPFSVVSETGRYELRGLPAGRTLIHAWHPRFPPVSRWVELSQGTVSELDIRMGAGGGRMGSAQ